MDSEFACKKCNKKFTLKANLQRHVNKQTCAKICARRLKRDAKQSKKIRRKDMEEFQCHICDKSFSNHCNKRRMLKHHLIQHDVEKTGKSPYQCNKCKKSFSWPHNKNAHEKNCNNKANFTCKVCNLKFMSNAEHLEHAEEHTQSSKKTPTGTNNPCEKGNQTLTLQTNLNRCTKHSKGGTATIKAAQKLGEFHPQRQGADPDKSHRNRPLSKALPYKCKQCDKTFSDINTEFEEFAKHQEWHRSEILKTDQSKSEPEKMSILNSQRTVEREIRFGYSINFIRTFIE